MLRLPLTLLLVLVVSRLAAAQTLAQRLEPLIQAHEGKVAVAVRQLASGESFEHQADVPMPTASLIKLPIMVETYRQAAEGKIDLAERLTLRDEDKVPGSGILTTHFTAGATITLRDAVRLMIAYSDNTATNLVLGKIGLPATAESMERLGLPNTKVHSFVFRAGSTIYPERSKEFGLGSTTAAEMIRLLADLHAKKLITPAACDEMLAHLRTCEDRRVPRLLPPGTKVAHKTGSVAAVRTAAGIIEATTGPIALCVLTSSNKDQRWTDDNAGEVLTSKIALAVFEHFRPAPNAAAATAESARQEVLRPGATGELVEALQRTLNARLSPSPELTIDGDFGPATKAAVQTFQRSKELEPTGEVGPETFRALGPLLFEAATPSPEEAGVRPLALAPREPLVGPPHTTCKAWIIGDAKTGRLVAGRRETDKLDIASTTKMMTALLVCELAAADPKVLAEEVTFSEAADKTVGSTAGIKAGEKLPVGELLYGLMLPSGNDASVALAEHFGSRVGSIAPPAGEAAPQAPAAEASESAPAERLTQFVAAMNARAAKLGLAATHYSNPHGLTDKEHKSTAQDQLQLAHAALLVPLFRQVVSTREHGAKVTGPGGYERHVVWKNTNRLLGIEGYGGVKTGTTDAAGACLVAYGERDGRELIVVVLGSDSSDARYVDARNLFRWAWSTAADSP